MKGDRNMVEFGKVFMLLGVFFVVVGAAAWVLGRAGLRALPGDLVYESDRIRVYFPIVTCILLSVLLTLALWAWQWLRGR